MKFLQQVPKETRVYETAQVKMIEYSYKQHLQTKEPKEQSEIEPLIKNTTINIKSFEPGNQLQEVK